MQVLLVGMGIVGRAIAADHLGHGIPVCCWDADEGVLQDAAEHLHQRCGCHIERHQPDGVRLPSPAALLTPAATFASLSDNESPPSAPGSSDPERWLLIESISERLDLKQAFFRDAEGWFDDAPILTSNTSTLSIQSIGEPLQNPANFAGFHFFMPVVQRDGVELIPHESTSPTTQQILIDHAHRLGKYCIPAADSPGFLVNRLLAPYLNLATWMVCGGLTAEELRLAANDYGMPLSPLELIDFISPRTAFDGGRIVWQAFPQRVEPWPLLPALIKKKLTGVAGGEGFYRYDDQGVRVGEALGGTAAALVERYRHDDLNPSRELATELLAACVQSEALAIQQNGLADRAAMTAALRGGLGWDGPFADGLSAISPSRCVELAEQFPQIKPLQIFLSQSSERLQT